MPRLSLPIRLKPRLIKLLRNKRLKLRKPIKRPLLTPSNPLLTQLSPKRKLKPPRRKRPKIKKRKLKLLPRRRKRTRSSLTSGKLPRRPSIRIRRSQRSHSTEMASQ